MNEGKVRDWMDRRMLDFSYHELPNIKTIAEAIERINAITDEAKLRLSNPNWPEAGE